MPFGERVNIFGDIAGINVADISTFLAATADHLYRGAYPNREEGNEKGINPNSWSSLFRIDQSGTDVSGELIKRYSRYKYGSSLDIEQFSLELGVLIQERSGELIKGDPTQWVVFTPPYSSVEPAVRPVGNKIAQVFNIPHIDFRTEPSGDKKTQYGAITDPQERLQARLAAQTVISDAVSLEAKNALVIDDVVTTGVTAAYMDRILYQQYHLGYVVGFCLINLVTVNPNFEEYINRFIINSGDLETLILILNDPRTIINRHTLKSLYGEDREVLGVITPRLLPSVIDRLQEARDRYFGEETS